MANAPADRAIDENQTLQEVLCGERALLLPTGGTAFIGVHMSLTMGWALLAAPTAFGSITIGNSTRAALILLAYLGTGLLAAFVPGFLVVSGYETAHARTRRVCRALVAVALAILVVSVVRVDQIAVVTRVGAVALFLLAARLVNGPGYSLAAAFFRARRRKAIEHRRARNQILGR